jgi:hypothetical protein
MNQPKRSWPLRTILFTLSFFAILAIGFTATITTLPQLPDNSGGVFTYANLSQLQTNLTTANTNFTNINNALTGSGTPPAINLNNAVGTPVGAGVTLSVVLPLTLTQLQTLNTVGVAVLPTPAATSAYVMGPCMLNLTHGSAAFTGGGTVTIGYGATSATTASNSTIASTVFTTFTASHLVIVQPTAQAVGATTLYAGLGIWMNAAGSDFASGTGGSGQLSCQYSIVTGVS